MPIRRSLACAAAAVLLAVFPARAQVLRAVVTDAATGAPVAEVMVRVETAAGEARAGGFTDAAGAVSLRLREGSYRVRAERSGYHAAAADVVVGAGGQTALTLRMEQRPFTIDTVTVIARSPDERGRDGFARRQALGLGVFLDSAYLAPRAGRVPFVADLLRGVPGIHIRPRGINDVFPVTERGWGCMVMLLDGRPFPLRFPDGGRREMHHVLGPRDVQAVEVYREWSEVPQEFRPYAFQGPYRCGVYLYWTRARW